MKRQQGKIAAAFFVLVLAAATATQAQILTTLHSFDGTDGRQPFASLVQATDGNLYGTVIYLGGDGIGTVYRITPTGAFTTLYTFCSQANCTDGDEPWAGLIQGTDGNLYGTDVLGGAYGPGTVFKITPSGTLTTLHSFDVTDGGNPFGGLVQATDGNFYGTTGGFGPNGAGTVFKITPTGTLTTLYSFCSQSGCADGGYSDAALVQGTDGNFYGTTALGGANKSCTFKDTAIGCGTVFKITPTGTLTTLYSFCSQSGCADGSEPFVALLQASDGNFYGTTANGGAHGAGTVFRITPSGTLITVYSFCSQSGCTDGQQPLAALVQATDGNFYGTTALGGANTCFFGFGCGTVFKITASGTLTTLYSFCSQSGCTDGANPEGGLIQATDGNFYGTTFNGGAGGACSGGCGTVFKLTLQTPQQATQAIINSVNALFSQGVLNGGQHNSLVRHLQHAIDMMNAGKNNGAIGNLDAFIGEVNDLLSSGVLSPSQAASLVSAAESVIARLS